MQWPSLFDFFFALVLILLWTRKRCDLCLIPTRFHGKKVWPFATIWFTGQCWRIKVPILSIFLSNFLWWFLGQTNGGAEGDDALPCKGLLCSIFFRFGFNITLNGKKLWPLSDSDEVPRIKGVTFCNNIIHGAVLKNKSFIFIFFFGLIFCVDFWDRLTAVLKVTALCHARAFFVRFFSPWF